MTKTPTYMTHELRAQLSCLSCNRVAAEARPSATGGPTTFALIRPEDAEYVRRRRCPSCLGSLWVGDPEVVTTFHKLPDSEVNPGPGRPKKAPSEKKTMQCEDCGKPRPYRAKDGGPRCSDCATKAMQTEAEARFRPIAEYLSAAGRPLGSRELADALGFGIGEMRGLLSRAIKRGVPIVAEYRTFRLETSA